jgi:hypothetical protein
MAKSNRQSAVIANMVRPGEGPLIDVSTIQGVGTHGLSTVTMGLNLAAAPVPDRRYVADRVGVFVRDSVTNLLFGQEKISGDDLRSLLVVKMNRDSVQVLRQTLAAMPSPTVKELVTASGGTGPIALKPIEHEPEQTVAFAANMMGASFTTSEACLDFYQASAASMAQVAVRKKLAVDPVVRVELRLVLADALFDEVVRLSDMHIAR